MPTSFFQYEMLPTTWFYLSALMIIAIFFRFNRFWSVRNLDLLGLIMLGTGLLYLAMYDNQYGYFWIFAVQLFFICRLFFDTVMVRRPLLEPNLTPGGLTFACIALLGFFCANIAVNRGERVDSTRTVRLDQILTLENDADNSDLALKHDFRDYPGCRPFFVWTEKNNHVVGASSSLLPQLEARKNFPKHKSDSGDRTDDSTILPVEPITTISTIPITVSEISATVPGETNLLNSAISTWETPGQAAKSESKPDTLSVADSFCLIAIISSHFLIVLAFLIIGHSHFGNIRTGIAAATLYLLLPYTNQLIGRLDHFIPGAFILWAIVFYRRPVFSGMMIGAAAALVFYPIFLLPLWCGFYWKRGWIRFLGGVVFVNVLFISMIFCTPQEYGSFAEQVANYFGRGSFVLNHPEGVWQVWPAFYRIPVIAMFLVFSVGMILWPSHKHLATLLSCSAIIIIGTQFWQPHQGGLYMAWYLPLLILTVFRPNLEDRIAQTTVVDLRYFF